MKEIREVITSISKCNSEFNKLTISNLGQKYNFYKGVMSHDAMGISGDL